MLQVITHVPAKINVVLSVGPARSDGYHELATVFHAVSLYDEVVATPAAGLSLVVDGPYADATPADETNLAARAARALAKHAGVAADVALRVRKAIPVAAGLAGGSADAAGALLACNELWRLGLSDAKLAAVAATLGSDVPFALHGGTAVGAGRGERLRSVDVGATLHWVLAVADGELATPAVYKRLDALRSGQRIRRPRVSRDLLTALGAADVDALAAEMGNDLQEAAIQLRPSLAEVLRAGRDLGALGGIVSGSGPTCVFLARDAKHSAEVAAELAATGSCADALAVTGPAAVGPPTA